MKKSEKCLIGIVAGMVYKIRLGGLCEFVYPVNIFLVISLPGTHFRKSS